MAPRRPRGSRRAGAPAPPAPPSAPTPRPLHGVHSVGALVPPPSLRPCPSPLSRVAHVAARDRGVVVTVSRVGAASKENVVRHVSLPARVEGVLCVGDARDGDAILRTWAVVALEEGVWVGCIGEEEIAGRWLRGGRGWWSACVVDGGGVIAVGESGCLCGVEEEMDKIGAVDGAFEVEAVVFGGEGLVVGRTPAGERALGLVRESALGFMCVIKALGGGMAISEGGRVVDAAQIPGRNVIAVLWKGGRVSWVGSRDGVCVRECVRVDAVGSAGGLRALGGGGDVCVISCDGDKELGVWSVRFEGGGMLKGTAAVDFVDGAVGCVVSEEGVVAVGEAGLLKDGFLWGEANEEDVLGKVVGRLERRLRGGIAALVEDLVVADEKEAIVGQARAVLGEVLDGHAGGFRENVFQEDLVEVLRPDDPGGEKRAGDALELRDGGAIPDAFAVRDGGLVRIVEAAHFVDAPGEFIYVAVDAIAVGRTGSEDGTDVEDILITLEVQLGDILSLAWEVNEWRGAVGKSVNDEMRRFRLLARTGLAGLVAASGVGLSDLEAEVHVVCSDGRRQALGTFQVMPLVVAAGTATRRVMRPPLWAEDALTVFADHAELVARGAGAEALRACAKKREIVSGGACVDVRAATDVALLNVQAPGVVAMAAAAAEVREGVGDDVVLEVFSGGGSRFSLLADAVEKLSKELEATRGFAKKSSNAGAKDLAHLFHTIAEADEAFGLVEEGFVAVNLATN